MRQIWTWSPVELSDGAVFPFIALGGLGFGWWPFNCMGTLAVGVCIMLVIEARRPFWKTRAVALFLLGGTLVEFAGRVSRSVSAPGCTANTRYG